MPSIAQHAKQQATVLTLHKRLMTLLAYQFLLLSWNLITVLKVIWCSNLRRNHGIWSHLYSSSLIVPVHENRIIRKILS